MPEVVFGTAQLFGLADEARSQRLLDEAWRAGFRRFDTAPSYGGGRSEPQLGSFLATRPEVELVSTKVGLAPRVGSRPGMRALVSVAKTALPAPITRRLRRSAQASAGGRFSGPEVTASVTESLRRLGGRIDRLLLHEVQPAEVTTELLDTLDGLLRQGDVGAAGVATQNELTAAALAAGAGVFTVAHFSVGPLAPPVVLPDSVTTRVGHGLLGGGGEHLRRMQEVLVGDPVLADRWQEATAGTEFAGGRGLTDALLSRGPHLDVTDLLVATTRVENVSPARALVSRAEPLPPSVLDVLTRLATRAGAGPQDRLPGQPG